MNKYGAKKTLYKGQMFDSKKEAEYAQFLELSKKARDKKDRVVSYESQVVYPIVINKIPVCKYIADFRVLYADGRIEIVDVKSAFTKKLPVYRLKNKLMKAVYGIDLIEA